MQTFVPYPSFAASAEALDSPRLGKQRVETLQILRALVIPTYGWQRHPAVGMWRGHVPALAAYGLATVDAWTARGFADTTAPQVAEFAPEVVGRSQQDLADAGLLPPWLGDQAVHESHRSRLIAKDPVVYADRFPGTPEGLDYVWPEPPAAAPSADGPALTVLRLPSAEPWREIGLVGLPLTGPRGTVTPAWRDQLRTFEDLPAGTRIGVLADDDPSGLLLAELTGPVAAATLDDASWAAAAARFDGRLERRDLPVPAALQNPRRLFTVPA